MERFVVGSGRCGSTLMSNLLGKHPDLLILSEFFATLDRPECFSSASLSGPEFGEFLDLVNPTVPITLRSATKQKEVLLDDVGPQGLSTLKMITLPTISAEPDKLYDELKAAVANFPVQRYADHYDQLFQWLMHQTGKSCWLERSGPSADYLPELIGMYPDARYVHLYRDGLETSMSMMHHPYFQLIISFFYDPPGREEILAGTDTLIRRLSPDYLPPEKYAEYWSYEQINCFRGLAQLDRDQYINVRYEDLIAEPAAALGRVAEFLELPERDGWIAEAAGMVTGMPPSRFAGLPPEVQDAVRGGCEAGQLLLGTKVADQVVTSLKQIRELSYSA
ncbi:MAG TPA: sulfotransferase [Streptosporangiaceae bacterium]|jgi:hypothetical protein|nr:sulfotransferase [Streptosporangiaceae bacterium]